MADFGVRITLSASSPVPTYNAAPWVSGVLKMTAGAPVSGWTSGQLIEVSPVGERVDIAQGGNYAEVSDFDCTVSAGWWLAFQAAGASLSGALVEVGAFSGSTFSARWAGVVSDNSWQGAELRIVAESLITKRHRHIPTRIVTAQEFPGLPAGSEGAVVPIVYGAVEGMTPPTILSDVDYLPAQYTRLGGVDSARATTFLVSDVSVPAVSLLSVPLCYGITEAGGSVPLDARSAIYSALLSGQSVFVSIVDGTGSGQVRRVPGTGSFGAIEPGNGFRVGWQSWDISTPWDTLPDETSVFRIYADAVAASLAVGDEATVSRVVAYSGDNEYPIGHSVQASGGITFVDVSAEFRNGEDYAALEYRAPTNVYGVPQMSDLITATTSNDVAGITSVVAAGVGYDFRTWDGYCRGRIESTSIPPDAIRDESDVYIMASLDASDLVKDSDTVSATVKAWPQVRIRRFVGADHWAQVVSGGAAGSLSVPFDSFNAFSPAIASDGSAGQFQSYAWKLPALPFPLSAISSIEWAVAMSARPDGSPQLAIGYVHVERSTGNNMVVPVGYRPATLPSVGDFIRPITGGGGEVYDGIPGSSGSSVYQSGYWREVTGIVDANTFTVSDASAWPTDDLEYIIVGAAQLATVHERETGVAFVYGAITRDSQFEVSTSAGRTYSGSPVTLARDVARDIFRRDLETPLTDTTAYASLPDDACTMALVDAEDSAYVLARMCREFNWVAGHNQAGQEVATAWLSRLFSATSDYSVTSADMVAGSITGLDASALEDLVTVPSLRWDWTQADGYRQQGAVTEVSTDPATLTAENYLATISGFGDFATSLDAYQILHAGWQASGLRRPAEIEYRYGGSPLSLYVPARMEWAAGRKDIATFRINDAHAAAAAYVGQRIAVSHKRYTAGGTGYGTLVAAYWYPGDGQVQHTVMFDPAV